MSDSPGPSAYRQAGVDIDAQDRALGGIGELVRSTATAGVIGEMGSFGGLFDLASHGGEGKVLVASADGVGTKLIVARMAGDYSTVGLDLVNHCVNDILTLGARPLFFLDYVGAGVLEPQSFADLVAGVSRGCRENGCALLGGETAEMPGFYQPGDYELVGFIVGLVERGKILDAAGVSDGDVVLGLASSGLHTNGYSLARHVLLDSLGLGLEDRLPDTDAKETVGELLLEPHLSYLPSVGPLLGQPGVKAIAHITGGGMTDNLPRVLPVGHCAHIRVGTWPIPPIFGAIQEHGAVADEEMFQVFNMGIGLILVVAADRVAEVLREVREHGARGMPIGLIRRGGTGVVYDFGPVADRESV